MKEIKGDLIKLAKEGKFDYIGHGCNCRGRMGAGIALQISKEFPEVSRQDKVTENNILGGIDVVRVEKYNFYVINAYTQFHWGKANNKFTISDTQNVRYDAIRNCMIEINSEFKGKKLGLPLIGCGLAGGDWKIVKKIIEEELIDCDVTIVYYDK